MRVSTTDLEELKAELKKAWRDVEQQKAAAVKAEKARAVEKVAGEKDRAQLQEVKETLKGMYKARNALQVKEEKAIEDRMEELSYQEEIMARQRSRITWLSEGDRNTEFFQRKASARRSKNRISQLNRADGSVCTDRDELANMATEFYASLYPSEGTIGME